MFSRSSSLAVQLRVLAGYKSTRSPASLFIYVPVRHSSNGQNITSVVPIPEGGIPLDSEAPSARILEEIARNTPGTSLYNTFKYDIASDHPYKLWFLDPEGPLYNFMINVASRSASVLEHIHDVTGMPWWLSIIMSGALVRIVLLPLNIFSLRNMSNASKASEDIAAVRNAYQQANIVVMKRGNLEDRVKLLKASLRGFRAALHRVNCYPWKSLLPPFVQVPVAVAAVLGARHAVLLGDSSFEVEGALWFQDLSVSDPYYALPVIAFSTAYLSLDAIFRRKPTGRNIAVGSSSLLGGKLGNTIRETFQIVTIIGLPFFAELPSGMYLLMTANSVWTLLYLAAVRSPRIYRFLTGVEAPSAVSSSNSATAMSIPRSPQLNQIRSFHTAALTMGDSHHFGAFKFTSIRRSSNGDKPGPTGLDDSQVDDESELKMNPEDKLQDVASVNTSESSTGVSDSLKKSPKIIIRKPPSFGVKSSSLKLKNEVFPFKDSDFSAIMDELDELTEPIDISMLEMQRKEQEAFPNPFSVAENVLRMTSTLQFVNSTSRLYYGPGAEVLRRAEMPVISTYFHPLREWTLGGINARVPIHHDFNHHLSPKLTRFYSSPFGSTSGLRKIEFRKPESAEFSLGGARTVNETDRILLRDIDKYDPMSIAVLDRSPMLISDAPLGTLTPFQIHSQATLSRVMKQIKLLHSVKSPTKFFSASSVASSGTDDAHFEDISKRKFADVADSRSYEKYKLLRPVAVYLSASDASKLFEQIDSIVLSKDTFISEATDDGLGIRRERSYLVELRNDLFCSTEGLETALDRTALLSRAATIVRAAEESSGFVIPQTSDDAAFLKAVDPKRAQFRYRFYPPLHAYRSAPYPPSMALKHSNEVKTLQKSGVSSVHPLRNPMALAIQHNYMLWLEREGTEAGFRRLEADLAQFNALRNVSGLLPKEIESDVPVKSMKQSEGAVETSSSSAPIIFKEYNGLDSDSYDIMMYDPHASVSSTADINGTSHTSKVLFSVDESSRIITRDLDIPNHSYGFSVHAHPSLPSSSTPSDMAVSSMLNMSDILRPLRYASGPFSVNQMMFSELSIPAADGQKYESSVGALLDDLEYRGLFGAPSFRVRADKIAKQLLFTGDPRSEAVWNDSSALSGLSSVQFPGGTAPQPFEELAEGTTLQPLRKPSKNERYVEHMFTQPASPRSASLPLLVGHANPLALYHFMALASVPLGLPNHIDEPIPEWDAKALEELGLGDLERSVAVAYAELTKGRYQAGSVVFPPEYDPAHPDYDRLNQFTAESSSTIAAPQKSKKEFVPDRDTHWFLYTDTLADRILMDVTKMAFTSPPPPDSTSASVSSASLPEGTLTNPASSNMAPSDPQLASKEAEAERSVIDSITGSLSLSTPVVNRKLDKDDDHADPHPTALVNKFVNPVTAYTPDVLSAFRMDGNIVVPELDEAERAVIADKLRAMYPDLSDTLALPYSLDEDLINPNPTLSSADIVALLQLIFAKAQKSEEASKVLTAPITSASLNIPNEFRSLRHRGYQRFIDLYYDLQELSPPVTKLDLVKNVVLHVTTDPSDIILSSGSDSPFMPDDEDFAPSNSANPIGMKYSTPVLEGRVTVPLKGVPALLKLLDSPSHRSSVQCEFGGDFTGENGKQLKLKWEEFDASPTSFVSVLESAPAENSVDVGTVMSDSVTTDEALYAELHDMTAEEYRLYNASTASMPGQQYSYVDGPEDDDAYESDGYESDDLDHGAGKKISAQSAGRMGSTVDDNFEEKDDLNPDHEIMVDFVQTFVSPMAFGLPVPAARVMCNDTRLTPQDLAAYQSEDTHPIPSSDSPNDDMHVLLDVSSIPRSDLALLLAFHVPPSFYTTHLIRVLHRFLKSSGLSSDDIAKLSRYDIKVSPASDFNLPSFWEKFELSDAVRVDDLRTLQFLITVRFELAADVLVPSILFNKHSSEPTLDMLYDSSYSAEKALHSLSDNGISKDAYLSFFEPIIKAHLDADMEMYTVLQSESDLLESRESVKEASMDPLVAGQKMKEIGTHVPPALPSGLMLPPLPRTDSVQPPWGERVRFGTDHNGTGKYRFPTPSASVVAFRSGLFSLFQAQNRIILPLPRVSTTSPYIYLSKTGKRFGFEPAESEGGVEAYAERLAAALEAGHTDRVLPLRAVYGMDSPSVDQSQLQLQGPAQSSLPALYSNGEGPTNSVHGIIRYFPHSRVVAPLFGVSPTLHLPLGTALPASLDLSILSHFSVAAESIRAGFGRIRRMESDFFRAESGDSDDSGAVFDGMGPEEPETAVERPKSSVLWPALPFYAPPNPSEEQRKEIVRQLRNWAEINPTAFPQLLRAPSKGGEVPQHLDDSFIMEQYYPDTSRSRVKRNKVVGALKVMDVACTYDLNDPFADAAEGAAGFGADPAAGINGLAPIMQGGGGASSNSMQGESLGEWGEVDRSLLALEARFADIQGRREATQRLAVHVREAIRSLPNPGISSTSNNSSSSNSKSSHNRYTRLQPRSAHVGPATAVPSKDLYAVVKSVFGSGAIGSGMASNVGPPGGLSFTSVIENPQKLASLPLATQAVLRTAAPTGASGFWLALGLFSALWDQGDLSALRLVYRGVLPRHMLSRPLQTVLETAISNHQRRKLFEMSETSSLSNSSLEVVDNAKKDLFGYPLLYPYHQGVATVPDIELKHVYDNGGPEYSAKIIEDLNLQYFSGRISDVDAEIEKRLDKLVTDGVMPARVCDFVENMTFWKLKFHNLIVNAPAGPYLLKVLISLLISSGNPKINYLVHVAKEYEAHAGSIQTYYANLGNEILMNRGFGDDGYSSDSLKSLIVDVTLSNNHTIPSSHLVYEFLRVFFELAHDLGFPRVGGNPFENVTIARNSLNSLNDFMSYVDGVIADADEKGEPYVLDAISPYFDIGDDPVDINNVSTAYSSALGIDTTSTKPKRKIKLPSWIRRTLTKNNVKNSTLVTSEVVSPPPPTSTPPSKDQTPVLAHTTVPSTPPTKEFIERKLNLITALFVDVMRTGDYSDETLATKFAELSKKIGKPVSSIDDLSQELISLQKEIENFGFSSRDRSYLRRNKNRYRRNSEPDEITADPTTILKMGHSSSIGVTLSAAKFLQEKENERKREKEEKLRKRKYDNLANYQQNISKNAYFHHSIPREMTVNAESSDAAVLRAVHMIHNPTFVRPDTVKSSTELTGDETQEFEIHEHAWLSSVGAARSPPQTNETERNKHLVESRQSVSKTESTSSRLTRVRVSPPGVEDVTPLSGNVPKKRNFSRNKLVAPHTHNPYTNQIVTQAVASVIGAQDKISQPPTSTTSAEKLKTPYEASIGASIKHTKMRSAAAQVPAPSRDELPPRPAVLPPRPELIPSPFKLRNSTPASLSATTSTNNSTGAAEKATEAVSSVGLNRALSSISGAFALPGSAAAAIADKPRNTLPMKRPSTVEPSLSGLLMASISSIAGTSTGSASAVAGGGENPSNIPTPADNSVNPRDTLSVLHPLTPQEQQNFEAIYNLEPLRVSYWDEVSRLSTEAAMAVATVRDYHSRETLDDFLLSAVHDRDSVVQMDKSFAQASNGFDRRPSVKTGRKEDIVVQQPQITSLYAPELKLLQKQRCEEHEAFKNPVSYDIKKEQINSSEAEENFTQISASDAMKRAFFGNFKPVPIDKVEALWEKAMDSVSISSVLNSEDPDSPSKSSDPFAWIESYGPEQYNRTVADELALTAAKAATMGRMQLAEDLEEIMNERYLYLLDSVPIGTGASPVLNLLEEDFDTVNTDDIADINNMLSEAQKVYKLR